MPVEKGKNEKDCYCHSTNAQRFSFRSLLLAFSAFFVSTVCPKEWHRPRRRNGPLELSLVVCRQSFRQNCA